MEMRERREGRAAPATRRLVERNTITGLALSLVLALCLPGNGRFGLFSGDEGRGAGAEPASRDEAQAGRSVRLAGLVDAITARSQVNEGQARRLARAVHAASREAGIESAYLLAIIKVESDYRRDAVSPRGARGLMQLRPRVGRAVAREVGISWPGPAALDQPELNVMLGARYFAQLAERFRSAELALVAYNIGPTRLRGLLRAERPVPKRYLQRVLAEYRQVNMLLPS